MITHVCDTFLIVKYKPRGNHGVKLFSYFFTKGSGS